MDNKYYGVLNGEGWGAIPTKPQARSQVRRGNLIYIINHEGGIKMYVTDLMPAPTQQKSFYSKARLVQVDKLTLLRSYETFVAQYDQDTKKLTVNGFYSNTTTRHIKAFVYFITGEFLSTKEIEGRYYQK